MAGTTTKELLPVMASIKPLPVLGPRILLEAQAARTFDVLVIVSVVVVTVVDVVANVEVVVVAIDEVVGKVTVVETS